MGALGAGLGLALRSAPAALATALVFFLAAGPDRGRHQRPDRPLGDRRRLGRADRQRRVRPGARLGRRAGAARLRGAARRRRRAPDRAQGRAVTWAACSPASTAPSDPPRRPASPSPTRGCCAATACSRSMRLYAGRPFALEDHYARMARTCARAAAGGGPRRAARGGRRAARRGRPRRRRSPDRRSRAAGGGSGSSSRCPARPADRPRGHDPLRADARPRRPQVALLRREHARDAAGEGAGPRRGAARHAARPRARGPDVVVLLGPRRRAADAAAGGPHPRLDHPRAGHRRPPARARSRARWTTLAADEAFLASSVREIMPVAAIDDRALPAAPGPVTQRPPSALRSTSSGSWVQSSSDGRGAARRTGNPRTRARAAKRRRRSAGAAFNRITRS